MEWFGRAPALPARELAGGAQEEHAIFAAIAVIGIDIGKNSFHLVGHDQRGAIVLRQKGHAARWKRGSRTCRRA
jgi:hypothetical protein